MQVLGPFHKSFTSIVGPNGSGKSNVIDSMLFVFGFKASKTRAAKLSFMIHNSSTYPNVQSAKVEVHFQEIIDRGDDFEVVPGSQFSVSRTVFKADSSSFYQIGTKRCKTKDVTKLLMEKGIDLEHNRFLILQGEVEQIALMKPKGVSENDTGSEPRFIFVTWVLGLVCLCRSANHLLSSTIVRSDVLQFVSR